MSILAWHGLAVKLHLAEALRQAVARPSDVTKRSGRKRSIRVKVGSALMASPRSPQDWIPVKTQSQHNNHEQRPAGQTPSTPQYAVTTLAHAPPSLPIRPIRPRPPRPAPASPSPNCSRHAAASAQARCQLIGRFVLGFRPNPLAGSNPCKSLTAMPDRLTLPAAVLVCFGVIYSRTPMPSGSRSLSSGVTNV
jgi:hypothetical protein